MQAGVDSFLAKPLFSEAQRHDDGAAADHEGCGRCTSPRMAGPAATEAIRPLQRADSADIPIIALTAIAFDEDVQGYLHACMNAHLSKPVEPERLYQILSNLIREMIAISLHKTEPL